MPGSRKGVYTRSNTTLEGGLPLSLVVGYVCMADTIYAKIPGYVWQGEKRETGNGLRR